MREVGIRYYHHGGNPGPPKRGKCRPMAYPRTLLGQLRCQRGLPETPSEYVVMLDFITRMGYEVRYDADDQPLILASNTPRTTIPEHCEYCNYQANKDPHPAGTPFCGFGKDCDWPTRMCECRTDRKVDGWCEASSWAIDPRTNRPATRSIIRKYRKQEGIE